MTETTFTYGVLPSREAFDAAFERECPDGLFAIRNDPHWGDQDLDSDELWDLVEMSVASWEHDGTLVAEQSGNWASCVLTVLGFEWI
jgi:hypothetical protein